MVYAAVVTRSASVRFGSRFRQTISIVETEGANAEEWSVAGLPTDFDIVSRAQTRVAGTSAAIGPTELGRMAAFALNTQDHIATGTEAPAVHIADQTRLVVRTTTGLLVGRSRPTAGAADNEIRTELVIEYGGVR